MEKKIMLSSMACCVAIVGAKESFAMDNLNLKLDKVDTLVRSEDSDSDVDERYVLKKTKIKSVRGILGETLLELGAQEKVEVLEEENGWAKVRAKGVEGYIELGQIIKNKDYSGEKYIKNVEYIVAYSDTTGKNEVGKIFNNEKVEVINKEGSYIKVLWNNQEVYIKGDKTYFSEDIKRVVRVGTSMYKSLNEIKAEKAKSDIRVTVDKEIGRHYKVTTSDGEGYYVRKEDVVEEKYIDGNITYPIRLQTKGSHDSDVRTYIAPGSVVEVVSYKGSYAKVKYGEYEGYVLANDLVDEVNQLKGYLLDRDEITLYKNGYKIGKDIHVKNLSEDSIKVVSNYGAYYKVEYNGKQYYMENTGLQVDNIGEIDKRYISSYPSKLTKVSTKYISESDVTVYLDKEKTTSLGIVTKDTQVDLKENLENGLSLVELNNELVYIETDKLSGEKLYTKTVESINTKDTGKSHAAFVGAIMNKLNIYVETTGDRKATKDEVAYYSNPQNGGVNDENYKYQFLKLDSFKMVDARVLNDYLNDLPGIDGVNIFENKADKFIESAKKYNINVIYLIAHTMLETGYGTSNLARGQKYDENTTVYNFFGIGAIDSNPLEGGKMTAYKNGWTTIDRTIEGSAKWLALNYIHANGKAQNTLYKMRYNYMLNTHQYASDIMWARKISMIMSKISKAYIDASLEFEVPLYLPKSYLKGVEKSIVDIIVGSSSKEGPVVEKENNNSNVSTDKNDKDEIIASNAKPNKKDTSSDAVTEETSSSANGNNKDHGFQRPSYTPSDDVDEDSSESITPEDSFDGIEEGFLMV